MNKHLYRVIFNERRGQFVVVSENVVAGAPTGAGSATLDIKPGGGAVAKRCASAMHPLALLLRTAFGIAAALALPGYAQIIGDPSAPGKQRPTVLQTANNVVQVNIQTPSEAGVSRNTYSQFDVTRDGAVLNNSRNPVQTQIGGWVQGNPWLLRSAARVILNEVNSSNPSQLRGYLEVAGQRAEVVIANPSGIDVDGAGFINANRVTLTTGVPLLQEGSLEGFVVQQGRVNVTGKGMDAAQTDYAGILARAVSLNANIWAKELRIVTGTNQIDTSAAATPADAAGPRPEFALDVAQLGGMYAGQITLIGTEAGVGARNAGTIEATSGKLVLNANGWLINSGSILASAPQASADIEATGDISNSGKLYSAGDINVTSGGDIASTGLIAAQHDASVLAVGAASRLGGGSDATYASGLAADGTMLGSGDLNLVATTSVSHHGAALAGAAMKVSGSEVDLSYATLSAGQINVVANAGNLGAIGAAITAKGVLDLNSAKFVNTDAVKAISEQLRIGARDWSNVGGEVLQSGTGDTDITLAGPDAVLDNTSGRIAVNSAKLRLRAGKLVNHNGKIEHAGTGTLTVSADLANSSGTIESNGNVTINAGALDNSGGRITAINDAAVGADVGLNNANGLISGGMHLTVQGGNVDNSHGTLQAHGADATLRVHDLNNASGSVFAAGRLDTVAFSVANSGTLYAAGDQHLAVIGAVANSGVIAAQGSTSISAQTLSSEAGSLLGGGVKVDGALAQTGALSITTTGGLFAHGQNLAAGQVSLQGGTVDLSGSQTGGAGIALNASDGDVITTGAVVAAAGMLAISANTAGHGLVNTQGTLSGGQLEVQVANLYNREGTLIQHGNGASSIAVNSGLDNTQGWIVANGPLSVQAGAIENNHGQITSGGPARISSLGTLNNSDGLLAAGNSLEVGGTVVDNTRGTIQSGDALMLDAASLQNSKGVLSAGTDLTVRLGGDLSNDALLYAGRNQILRIGGALTNTGSIASQGDTSIVAASVNSGAGTLLGAGIRADGSLAQSGSLTVQATGNLVATGQNLAAGDASFSGASVDVRGSDTAGRNIALAASSGDVHTAGANVSTAGRLSVTANYRATQALDNAQGNLSAGQLVLNVANLDNTHGTVIQTGAGDANITVNAQGRLDNTAGYIAVNSANLTLGGGTLVNTDGKIAHAGSGTLAIRAGTLADQRGQIAGNGIVDISADGFDHRYATTSARQIAISAANLDNRAGHIVQLDAGSGTVNVIGSLTNSAGTIESNGDATVSAGTLDNSGGRITAVGNAVIEADASLNNVEGLVAAGRHLALQGGNVDNSRGTLQAQGGDAMLRLGDLNNTDGSVYAGGKLDIAAASVANTGSLYATGDQVLSASGAVTNSGTIAAQGSTSVIARSLSSDAGSLLGAGVKADGSLVQSGDLSIMTTGTLAAHGQNLAPGQVSLQGATVDLSGSRTGGAHVALNADVGDVITSGATVATAGKLAITAAAEGHGLVNAGGSLSGGQLEMQVANFDNRQGTLVQSGSGDSSIVLTSSGGTLDNTGGKIGVNGRNLRIGAARLTNVDGRIEHAGTGLLDLAAGEIDGQRGEMIGNGAVHVSAGTFDHREATAIAETLSINAGTLDNSQGLIVQRGSANTSISVASSLNNSSGTISSNGNTAITASALYNAGGTLTAADGGNLTIQVAGNVDNSVGGFIAAASDVTINAGAILNQLGKINAGGTLRADSTGAIENTQGAIIGHADLHLSATQLTNSRGTVATELGQLIVNTNGTTNNDSGVIQAGDDLTLTNHGLSNAGSIVGKSININGNGQALRNDLGTIASSQNLSVHSGALSNTGGLIQAGGTLMLDTDGGDLNNSDAALHAGSTGGIVAGGDAQLRVGTWNNAGGFFGAGGAADVIATGTIENHANGQIMGASALGLTVAGLDNQGGQIQSLGNLTVKADAGNVNNGGSLIRAGGTLNISANGVDNSNTLGAGQGLEGTNIVLTTQTLNNDHGAIRADENAQISTAISVINTQGLISAGKTLSVGATVPGPGLSIDNGGGTLIAGSGMNVKAASMSGAGHLLSFGDLDLELAGDFIHAEGAELLANKGLSIKVAGDLSNSGKLGAGANLDIAARNVDNAASAEISSSGVTHVAAGTLANRGLIDGGTTELDAGAVDNAGMGRIYGGIISIAADSLNNDVEGGSAGTIAARAGLDIGVQTLNNREHALIFSTGDLAIGGTLDASRLASGRAASVTNASAGIEALGNLSLNAGQVNNLNNHFSTEIRVTKTEAVTEYSINNSPALYSADSAQVVADRDDPNISLLRVGGNDYETWGRYDFTRTTRETVITSSDPGRIAAGGNLAISVDSVLNDNSHILAGGFLGITGVLFNTETPGQKITTECGTATNLWRIHKKGTDEQGSASSAYAPPDMIESITVKDSRVEDSTASVSGSAPGVTATGAVTGATSSAGNATATVNAGAIVKVNAATGPISSASAVHATASAQAGQDSAAAISGLPTGPIDSATGLPVTTVTGQQGAESAALSAPLPSGAPAVGNVGGIAPSGRAQALDTLVQVAGGVRTVSTGVPSSALPGTSLFQVNPSPAAGYLIATDPRFANYQQWTGSDYMLAQSKLDPALTQKRLGDGFYEQKLMRDQVAQLTGQRFLGDYTNDDAQYRGLMDAGIAYAQELNLRPGVALTAEQMAALTKDMVWLVAQEVTLPDGTVQKVLAPQVYVVAHDKELTGAGAVISGRDVKVASTGDLSNTGSIFARDTAQLVAENINNLGGRIHADAVLASAKTDISNIAGTISAGHELIASAGRDINVETTTRSASSSAGANQFSRRTIDRVGSLSVTGDGGTLVADAGRDINLVAAQIANAGENGNTLLNAGRNLNLAAVTTASSNSIIWDPVRYRKEGSSTDVGAVVQGAGAITFQAGADINLRAASVDAGGALSAIAGNNLNIFAGAASTTFDQTSQTTKSGFLHRETITTRNTLDATNAIGSVLGGATVNLSAGNDLKVVGSSLVGDKDVNLIAKNAISIEAATNQSHETHYLDVQERGLLGGGGFGFSFGKRTTTTNQEQDASIQSGQARSTIGSIAGNVTMNAGDAIKIAGSDLAAGQDINLFGKSVSITPGVDALNGKYTTRMTQDALTLSFGGSVINAIQTVPAMSSAAGQVSSGRLKALAAASAAMTVKDAAQDLARNGPSVKVSLTVGHSESESTEVTASSTHVGSVLAAGRNVTIGATGGGKASNIDIVGSDLRAKGNVSLAADNQVNLLAAQDTESQHSQSKSSSTAVGVAAEISSKGVSYGLTASASASRGNVDGEGTTQVNSHVSAGDRLTITSGGDTNLKGAVASASQVVADIKGNLNIESLQDTATLDGKRQSASVSGTVGAGAGFGASVSQSQVHNEYASVQEQSGLRAGDGGFQIQVAGNTDLKGGVISSSEQAIKDGRNSLATGTLSFSDVQNRDSTDASGVSLGVNAGKNQNGSTFSPSMAPGIGKVSGSQGSVTGSGVSGGALTVADQPAGQAVANLNRDVSTGKDTAQALTKGWNGAQALDQVGAQMQITSAAMPRLAKEIGDYADARVAELKQQGNAEEAAKWAEGGIYRVAVHTALGAMGGGVDGALGGGSSAAAAPIIAKVIDGAGLPELAREAAITAVGAAVGAVAGGTAGAVTGGNQIANNYLGQHGVGIKKSEQAQFDYAVAACNNGDRSACDRRDTLIALSQQRDQLITNACASGSSADCSALVSAATSAGNKTIFGSDGKAVVYPVGTAELVSTPNVLDGTLHDQLAKSTLDGLLMATGDAAVAKVVGLVGKGVVAAVDAAKIVGSGSTIETTAGQQALAVSLNNFYREGASPALIQQTFNQAAVSSTHNAGSTEVILGKYIEGSVDSYEAVAQARGATYFSMSDWSVVQNQLGAEQMWNINKAFLDQQISQGKNFIFTADPALARVGSYTLMEYEHLLVAGYKIQPSTGGLFRAVKK